MKRLNIFGLAFFCFALILSCKKKDDKTEQPPSTTFSTTSSPQPSDLKPAPDSIAKKVRDINTTLLAITDVEMMTGMLTDQTNTFYPEFYSSVPEYTLSDGTGTTTIVKYSIGPDYEQTRIMFNKTMGRDGKVRYNNIFCTRALPTVTNSYANYYRDYQYSHYFYFSGYQVDDWFIQMDQGTSALVKNTVSSSIYNPQITNLSWEISGKFKFTNYYDSDNIIIWEGTITKTLSNTKDTIVFNKNKTKPITWNKAKIEFSGSISGEFYGPIPFTYSIDKDSPLVRDFTCKVKPKNDSLNILTEFHPFIKGNVSYTIGSSASMKVGYGDNKGGTPCDNSGTIRIGTQTYSLEF